MTYEEIVSGLRALNAEDFADYVPERFDELTDAVMELPEPECAVPELFAFMERLHDADLGSPGPLVQLRGRGDIPPEAAELLDRCRLNEASLRPGIRRSTVSG